MNYPSGTMPFLLWVKRPDAPKKESIRLDFYKMSADFSADTGWKVMTARIELYSTKGCELLLNAFSAKEPLQFGLVQGDFGRLFTGQILEYMVDMPPFCSRAMELVVMGQPFVEFDLSKPQKQRRSL